MDLTGKKVLVTGAGGFIGSHLVEALVERGAEVRCFVRYNSRNHWGLLEHLPFHMKGKLEVVPGNLTDPQAVRRIVRDMQVVFHLAALIAIPYSYDNPRDVVETNVLGTLNVLMAAREAGTEKLIHTSTSETYGTARYAPIDEEHPLQAQSPYSASKVAADKLAESFWRSYDLPVTVARPFNTYGPRQSARAVIPTIITQALTSRKVFLGSTHPARDFTYVSDTVEGFMRVAEVDASIGEVINLGSGTEVSIEGLVEEISRLMDRKPEVIFDASRLRPERSEVERLVCDNSKAQRLLGWRPSLSLSEGLDRTIRWISEHIDGYKADLYNV